jgi:hypothetical protein
MTPARDFARLDPPYGGYAAALLRLVNPSPVSFHLHLEEEDVGATKQRDAPSR